MGEWDCLLAQACFGGLVDAQGGVGWVAPDRLRAALFDTAACGRMGGWGALHNPCCKSSVEAVVVVVQWEW